MRTIPSLCGSFKTLDTVWRNRQKNNQLPLIAYSHMDIKQKAIDGTRTRDFHLGKVALYQLSHYRMTGT